MAHAAEISPQSVFPVVDLNLWPCQECLSASGLCSCLRLSAATQKASAELRSALTGTGFFYLVSDYFTEEAHGPVLLAAQTFFELLPLDVKMLAASCY